MIRLKGSTSSRGVRLLRLIFAGVATYLVVSLSTGPSAQSHGDTDPEPVRGPERTLASGTTLKGTPWRLAYNFSDQGPCLALHTAMPSGGALVSEDCGNGPSGDKLTAGGDDFFERDESLLSGLATYEILVVQVCILPTFGRCISVPPLPVNPFKQERPWMLALPITDQGTLDVEQINSLLGIQEDDTGSYYCPTPPDLVGCVAIPAANIPDIAVSPANASRSKAGQAGVGRRMNFWTVRGLNSAGKIVATAKIPAADPVPRRELPPRAVVGFERCLRKANHALTGRERRLARRRCEQRYPVTARVSHHPGH